MELLNPIVPSELPTEALLARLRSRRAVLEQRLAESGTSVGGPDMRLRAIYDWIYLHLNRRLRRQLQPYWELIAMGQVMVALRHRLAGEEPPPDLLRSRLLNPALTALLRQDRSPVDLVGTLTHAWRDVYPFAAGLQNCYLQQGPGGVELQLQAGILDSARQQAGPPALVWLTTYLIDGRNLLIILKLWRWQVRQSPHWLAGGSLDRDVLQRVWQHADRGRLLRLARQVSGQEIARPRETQVEQALLAGLANGLRRAGRDPLGLAVILDYLGRCQRLLHNQILRRALEYADRAPVREALLL